MLDPARVVMTGVRDLDGGERVELERAGVGTAPPDKLAGALEGDAVYVHLDLDVLDPSVLPAQFPAPGGLSSEGLRDLLGELAESATVVGVEITAFEAPEDEAERDRLRGDDRVGAWSRCCERAAPAGRGAARAPRGRRGSAAARRRSPSSTRPTS